MAAVEWQGYSVIPSSKFVDTSVPSNERWIGTVNVSMIQSPQIKITDHRGRNKVWLTAWADKTPDYRIDIDFVCPGSMTITQYNEMIDAIEQAREVLHQYCVNYNTTNG